MSTVVYQPASAAAPTAAGDSATCYVLRRVEELAPSVLKRNDGVVRCVGMNKLKVDESNGPIKLGTNLYYFEFTRGMSWKEASQKIGESGKLQAHHHPTAYEFDGPYFETLMAFDKMRSVKVEKEAVVPTIRSLVHSADEEPEPSARRVPRTEH